MIIEEMLTPTRVRNYSDLNFKIRQVETGIIYDDAVDPYPCKWTYEETDIPIDDIPEPIDPDDPDIIPIPMSDIVN